MFKAMFSAITHRRLNNCVIADYTYLVIPGLVETERNMKTITCCEKIKDGSTCFLIGTDILEINKGNPCKDG